MTSPQHTVFAYVCFERTPLAELSDKARTFEQHGWTWVDKHVRWIARACRESNRPLSAEIIENEIRELMGDRYLPLREVGALGSTYGEEPDAVKVTEDPLVRERALLQQVVGEGWELTTLGKSMLEGGPLPEASSTDSAVEAQGGAQLAIKPAEPGPRPQSH